MGSGITGRVTGVKGFRTIGAPALATVHPPVTFPPRD
jgi:hypothetical protein